MLCTKPIGRIYKGYYIDFYKDENGNFWFPMRQIMETLNIKDIDLNEVVDMDDKGQYRIEKIDGKRIPLLSIRGIDYFEKHEYQRFPFFFWLRAESLNMYNLFKWLKTMGKLDGATTYLKIPEENKLLLADLLGFKVKDIWG